MRGVGSAATLAAAPTERSWRRVSWLVISRLQAVQCSTCGVVRVEIGATKKSRYSPERRRSSSLAWGFKVARAWQHLQLAARLQVFTLLDLGYNPVLTVGSSRIDVLAVTPRYHRRGSTCSN